VQRNLNHPIIRTIEKVVDENGHFTPVWKETLSSLFQQLQKNYSEEGLFVPQQNSANVTRLETSKSKSSFLYNHETDKMLVNINGTYKEIQTV